MGVITRKPPLVKEAIELFEADATRQSFTPSRSDFVISPLNARGRLMKFIAAARRELMVYDPRILDTAMIRLLTQRKEAGVDVRILGRSNARGKALAAQSLEKQRLHLRAMLRDGRELFIGSQSLRPLELDRRREVGVIVRDAHSLKRFRTVFEEDWAAATKSTQELEIPLRKSRARSLQPAVA